jgi:uncharacterized protein
MSSGDWKELFDAACQGDLDLVKYHIHNGVDLNHIHPEYTGTILVASILAKQESAALELLAHGANPNQYSPQDGFAPLEAALHVQLKTVESELRTLGAKAMPKAQARGWLANWLKQLSPI